jgi:hypothetical protein
MLLFGAEYFTFPSAVVNYKDRVCGILNLTVLVGVKFGFSN